MIKKEIQYTIACDRCGKLVVYTGLYINQWKVIEEIQKTKGWKIINKTSNAKRKCFCEICGERQRRK